MEKQRTFVDNWKEREDSVFQLIMSDEIQKAFNDNPPKQTPIYKKELSETDSVYYINNVPVLGMRYNPEKAIHTLYVKQSGRNNEVRRRSENITQKYNLPTARNK